MKAGAVAVPDVRPARVRMMLGLTSLLLLCGALGAHDAHAQGGALEAPMQPIDKTDATPSKCAKCPTAHTKDRDLPRVADPSAPEYPGARADAVPEMEPSEPPGSGLPAVGSLPIGSPLR